MIKSIATTTALVLSLAGTAGAAEGFQPWADRAADTAVSASQASAADNGFRPWDQRAVSADELELQGEAMITDTGFRPWVNKAS